jgi:hypothetical protein
LFGVEDRRSEESFGVEESVGAKDRRSEESFEKGFLFRQTGVR